MDKKILFGIGAAIAVGGLVGYKLFSAIEDAREGEKLPAPLPPQKTNVPAPVAPVAVAAVEEVTVAQEVMMTPVEVAEDSTAIQIEETRDIGMASITVEPVVVKAYAPKSEEYLNAQIKLAIADAESRISGDQTGVLKATLDTFTAALTDPEIMSRLGQDVRLIHKRKNRSMLVFTNTLENSPIASYGIESDKNVIRGVEVRMRTGARRYDRKEDEIIDALFALGHAFETKLGPVMPVIDVASNETAIS